MVNVGFICFCDSHELKAVSKWEIWKKGKFRLFFSIQAFFLFALSLSCFSPQWLCLTSSPRNLKKPTELVDYMIFVWTVFLGERSKKQKNTLCSLCFPVLRSHLEMCISLFFFFSSFSTPLPSLPSPLRYLDSWGWMCVLQRLWPWHLV